MAQYTYKDYKERISIMQVALELGYRFDRSKGKAQPSFVRYDDHGREMDRIYIKNPNDYARMGYWRRHLTSGNNSGDLIGFIRENITEFNEYVTARNEVDAINKVLARMANVTLDNREVMRQFMDTLKESTARTFRLDRYDRQPGNVTSAMKLLAPRGISQETAELFRDNFEMIQDREGKGNFKNLAFPFRRPGLDDIVGYEVRGYGGFKSKAEGTDSTNACWMAYVGSTPPEDRAIDELHFAESALDIMAFVQLNRDNLDLERCLFISFGGSFSTNQMKGVLEEYACSTPVLHFDNDTNGVIYDCETACILAGKTIKHRKQDQDLVFTVGEREFAVPLDKLSYNRFRQGAGFMPPIRLWKAPSGFKDWNDMTIDRMKREQGEIETHRVSTKDIMEQAEDRRRGYTR